MRFWKNQKSDYQKSKWISAWFVETEFPDFPSLICKTVKSEEDAGCERGAGKIIMLDRKVGFWFQHQHSCLKYFPTFCGVRDVRRRGLFNSIHSNYAREWNRTFQIVQRQDLFLLSCYICSRLFGKLFNYISLFFTL